MSKIVAVRKDETGKIKQYQLDDGRVLDTVQAVEETNAGRIEGCTSFTTRDGDASIRSNRGQEGYSLSSLPEF